MPILRRWHIAPDVDMVLRAQGADPETLRERSPDAVRAAERAVADGQPMLSPVVQFRRLDVRELRHEKLLLEGGGALQGPLVGLMLAPAEQVVVMIVTIGEALERAASAAFEEDPAYAAALDMYGSCAVTELTAAACIRFTRRAGGDGLQPTLPLSPGLDGWPVAEGQRQVFDLLESSKIGVVLTDDGQMIPRKSTTMAVGFGHDVDPGGDPCVYCSLHPTCRFHERHGE